MLRWIVTLGLLAGWVLGPASLRSGEPAKFQFSKAELDLIELTNLERKKHKLPPFKAHPILGQLARAHSENMAKQGKLEHKLDGKEVGDRVQASPYKASAGAENIATGSANVPLVKVMQGWMNSQGHRENLLYEKYTEIGIGIARDQKGQVWYTQVFARPLEQK